MSLLVNGRVAQDRVSAEISRDNYVELVRPREWATHPFFDGDEDKIIAINNSNDEQQFVLGTMAKSSNYHNEFQPFGLLRKLKTKEGLATEVPGYIQAYSVVGYSSTSLLL